MEGVSFHKIVTAWLTPMGFSEVYRQSHLVSTDDEIHFMKHGIRVICKKVGTEAYAYCHVDCLKVEPIMAILTLKIAIGSDEIVQVIENVTQARTRIEEDRDELAIENASLERHIKHISIITIILSSIIVSLISHLLFFK